MADGIYKMVTDRIIAQLEKGIIPWQKPWTGTIEGAFNRTTKRPYSLINQMLLTNTGEYASYKQWAALGGQVKKGEKGEIVVFWKIHHYKETDKETGEEVEKAQPVLRYYNVFHISQVEGVEPLNLDLKEMEHKPHEEAEAIISQYIKREKVKIERTKSNRAYYRPSTDSITVPSMKQFPKREEFYSTLFHEMVHSTGHKSRLNRLETGLDAAFGSESYSKEELVAEIGAASLVNSTGMETEASFKNSAGYIQSWLRALKNDVKLITSAAGKAEKAVEYIKNGKTVTNHTSETESEE